MSTMKQPARTLGQNSIGISRRHRGLTLVELIFALGITVLACTAAAMTIKAVADGCRTDTDAMDTADSAGDVIARLRAIVKEAWLIGFYDDYSLVLWANDTNGNLQIDYTECVMLRYDQQTGDLQLLDIHFPDGTSESEIDAHKITLTYNQLCSHGMAWAISQDQYLRTRTLARQVFLFSFSVDPEPPYSRSVVFSFKLKDPDASNKWNPVITLYNPAFELLQ